MCIHLTIPRLSVRLQVYKREGGEEVGGEGGRGEGVGGEGVGRGGGEEREGEEMGRRRLYLQCHAAAL